jgi:sensor histidine kinase YesM
LFLLFRRDRIKYKQTAPLSMERIIKENLLKNLILIVLLALLYGPIDNYLLNSNLAADKQSAGNILVATSIIAVIACFGAFAFTYEKINAKKSYARFLAHFTTGLLMLIIGITLIFTTILSSFIMGSFILFNIIAVLLYIAVMGYDLWDLLRLTDK